MTAGVVISLPPAMRIADDAAMATARRVGRIGYLLDAHLGWIT
jgi:hypothetical protein